MRVSRQSLVLAACSLFHTEIRNRRAVRSAPAKSPILSLAPPKCKHKKKSCLAIAPIIQRRNHHTSTTSRQLPSTRHHPFPLRILFLPDLSRIFDRLARPAPNILRSTRQRRHWVAIDFQRSRAFLRYNDRFLDKYSLTSRAYSSWCCRRKGKSKRRNMSRRRRRARIKNF